VNFLNSFLLESCTVIQLIDHWKWTNFPQKGKVEISVQASRICDLHPGCHSQHDMYTYELNKPICSFPLPKCQIVADNRWSLSAWLTGCFQVCRLVGLTRQARHMNGPVSSSSRGKAVESVQLCKRKRSMWRTYIHATSVFPPSSSLSTLTRVIVRPCWHQINRVYVFVPYTPSYSFPIYSSTLQRSTYSDVTLASKL
jgi:hypothetical protein